MSSRVAGEMPSEYVSGLETLYKKYYSNTKAVKVGGFKGFLSKIFGRQHISKGPEWLGEIADERFYNIGSLKGARGWWFKNPVIVGSLALAAIAGGIGFAFSGKDDDHNTIEGLSHKGMAGKLRKQNTDFGSGWRGLFSRIAKGLFGKKAWSITAAELRGMGAEAESLSKGSVNFYKRLYKEGAISKSEFKQMKGIYSGKITVPKHVNVGYERIREGLVSKGFGPLDPLDELMAKLGGSTGSVSINGFSEQGIAAVNRKTVGFGSPAILEKIVGFARRLFKNSKSMTSFEKMISPMSEAEIGKFFGGGAGALNPAEIRSGAMDAFITEKQSAREAIKASQRMSIEVQEKAFQNMISPVAPHKQFQIFGGEAKAINAEEIRQMSNEQLYEKMGFKMPEVRRFEKSAPVDAEVEAIRARKKAERIAKQQDLHKSAQKQFWQDSVKTGRGHVNKDISSFAGNLNDTVIRGR